MEAQELLKEYNNLFKLFLLAGSRIQEFKIYLKMRKIEKKLKKINKKLFFNENKNCFEFKED